jgi:hypothetical protein
VVLRAHVEPFGGYARRLRVTAENVGANALVLELPDRCPNGPIDFTGLDSSYDYYGTCNAGACAGTRPPKRITLAPGVTTDVASTTLHLGGAPPCTTRLTEGRRRIVPVAPELGVPTCVVGAVLDVPAIAEAPPPRPKPPGPSRPSSPSPPPPAAGDPYACTQHSDCVLSCPRADGCCGWPCGCRHAIHRDHRAAFEAGYPDTCSKPPCPAVGCAYQPAVAAACHNGRCTGVTSLSF